MHNLGNEELTPLLSDVNVLVVRRCSNMLMRSRLSMNGWSKRVRKMEECAKTEQRKAA